LTPISTDVTDQRARRVAAFTGTVRVAREGAASTCEEPHEEHMVATSGIHAPHVAQRFTS
jgi:hypothetical protein